VSCGEVHSQARDWWHKVTRPRWWPRLCSSAGPVCTTGRQCYASTRRRSVNAPKTRSSVQTLRGEIRVLQTSELSSAVRYAGFVLSIEHGTAGENHWAVWTRSVSWIGDSFRNRSIFCNSESSYLFIPLHSRIILACV